jgi:hypothetical protein
VKGAATKRREVALIDALGRRDELDDVSNYVRNSYRSLHRVQVCTYDRFVQVARNADRNDRLTRKGAA